MDECRGFEIHGRVEIEKHGLGAGRTWPLRCRWICCGGESKKSAPRAGDKAKRKKMERGEEAVTGGRSSGRAQPGFWRWNPECGGVPV